MFDVASSFLPRLAPSGPFLTGLAFFGLTSCKFIDPATIVPLAQQTGTPEHPFATLAQGVAALGAEGTLFLAPGQTYPAESLDLLAKNITLFSPGSENFGGVGDAPDLTAIEITHTAGYLGIVNVKAIGPITSSDNVVLQNSGSPAGLACNAIDAQNSRITGATCATAHYTNCTVTDCTGGRVEIHGGSVAGIITGTITLALDSDVLFNNGGGPVTLQATAGGGKVSIYNCARGWDAAMSVLSPTSILTDAETYQAASTAGLVGVFTRVLGPASALFTVAVPALAAGKVGVVSGYDISTATCFATLDAAQGTVLKGSAVDATLPPGAPDCGYLVDVVMDGPHTVSWTFVGPLTGGDADFNLACVNQLA